MAIEIVDLPIKNGGSFHSYVSPFTRGYPENLFILEVECHHFVLTTRNHEKCLYTMYCAEGIHDLHKWTIFTIVQPYYQGPTRLGWFDLRMLGMIFFAGDLMIHPNFTAKFEETLFTWTPRIVMINPLLGKPTDPTVYIIVCKWGYPNSWMVYAGKSY